ncbi:MAG: pyridoxamine 5'-phosphate oxidase family protein [Myxococcales bacterium]
MQQSGIDILDANRTMTIATVRPDGWPQATIVGYANEGFDLYFLIYRDSQKFANISRDNRVAISVGHEPRELRDVKAVYAACEVWEITDLAQRGRVWTLLEKRHPQLTDLAPPGTAEVATMCARCKHISVLDYSKGLGHSEAIHLDAERPDR